MSNLRKIVRSVLQFALVSGIGLAIDFAIFLSLVAAGASPFFANLTSGGCAVAFVYFASVRRIFSYRGEFLLGLFAAYLAYQAAAVTAASLAVGYLAQQFGPPALAKLAILPVTFAANYVFMWMLTRQGAGRGAGRGADGRGQPSHG